MNKTIYITILILSFIGIFLFEFMAFNSMVSLKYETKEITDCISIVSGVDLCKSIKTFHLFALLSGLIFLLLLFKNKFSKNNISYHSYGKQTRHYEEE